MSDTDVLKDFGLRVLHVGGDYGNFITWALSWLDNPEYQTVQEVLRDTGSAHDHSGWYYDRETQSMLSGKNAKDPIIRLHYNIGNSKITSDDIQNIASYGPTIVVDPANCYFELIANREEKMPAGSFQEVRSITTLKSEFNAYMDISDTINKVAKDNPNIYVLKMQQLIKNPAFALSNCYKWWRGKESEFKTTAELRQSLDYWKSKQKYFNLDEKLLGVLVTSNKEIREATPDVRRHTYKDLSNDLVRLFQGKSLHESRLIQIWMHLILQNINANTDEFQNLKNNISVRNYYSLIDPVYNTHRANINAFFEEAFPKDFNLASVQGIVMHPGGAYGHWLMYLLDYLSGKDVVRYDLVMQENASAHGYNAPSLLWEHKPESYGSGENLAKVYYMDRNCQFLRVHTPDYRWLAKHYLTHWDFITELKKQTNNIIIVDSENTPLERVLNCVSKTWDLWPVDNKKVAAANLVKHMFDQKDEMSELLVDDRLIKVSVEDITQHTLDTLTKILTFCNIDIKRSLNDVVPWIEHWRTTQQFIGIDKQFNKYNSLKDFKKHEYAMNFVEDFFNDK